MNSPRGSHGKHRCLRLGLNGENQKAALKELQGAKMKRFLLLLLGGYVQLRAEDVSATPVQKVLELLSTMKKKGEEEKQKEAVQFAAYEQFCESTQKEKAKGIEEGEDKIESIKADLGKLSVDIANLQESIPEVVEEIDKVTAEQQKATKARGEERTAYTAAHSEYLKAVQSVGKARKALKEQEVTPEQAESFLQLASKGSDLTDEEIDAFTSSSQARAAIEAFISEGTSVEKPAEGAYTFQSGKVIELLDQLEDKFKTERVALEKSETEKKHAYEMLMRDLLGLVLIAIDWKAQLATGKKTKEDKLAAKLRKDQVKAEKSAALVEVSKLNEDDKKYLADLKQTCDQKASDFKERQRLRGEELAAIDKASEAIQGTVLKVTEKKSSSKGTSLAALRSDSGGAKREQAISLLREKAEELDSNMLSALVLRAEGDSLSKIRKMISDLVTRLQQEAAADAEKDGWCKKELATNGQTRSSKKDLVDTVQGEVNQLKIDITELGDDLESLQKDIASLAKDRESATKLRENEKVENKATIKDAQDAQKAIAQATAALDSFYSGAKAKASLLQKPEGAPEIFEDSSYTGMDSGGVTALLEVLQADFVRMESETETAEAQSLGEYTKFMSDSAVDKASKEKEVELKTASKTEKTNALTTKQIDLKDAQKALKAATEYFEELKGQCMKPVMTREEKMEKRKQERL
eukprot:s1215_g19.t1